MADINIRRKKKPLWPWLLALVIVVGIIWILAETTGDPEVNPEGTSSPENTTSMDDASDVGADNEFTRFVSEHEPPKGDSLKAVYIIDGMDHLSATLGTVVDKKFIHDPEVNEKRSTLTSKIDELKADSSSERLPGHVKEAFVSAADLMASLQEASYPELDGTVSDLRKVAASIENDPDLKAFNRKVERFFEESSDATLKMTDSTARN